ncbi:MAG: SCO family protein [Hymenobacter sp.]|nr:MAG: SCO family protein [Hymenobacter sp.]
MLHTLLRRAGLPLLLGAALLAGCGEPERRLPILGERDVRENPKGGPADTIFATVPAFRVHDQNGQLLTNQALAGQVYLTDFFFATCPGICPKMNGELLKVYQQHAHTPGLKFVSFTIDPDHDTTAVLRDYAQRLGVPPAGSWRFVRTSADSVFALASSFYTAAMPDKTAPGGFAHNGTFALVDDQGHVRGLYDSLNPQEVARLQEELPVLLAEVQQRQKKS